jgi:hypothetical protein
MPFSGLPYLFPALCLCLCSLTSLSASIHPSCLSNYLLVCLSATRHPVSFVWVSVRRALLFCFVLCLFPHMRRTGLGQITNSGKPHGPHFFIDLKL